MQRHTLSEEQEPLRIPETELKVLSGGFFKAVLSFQLYLDLKLFCETVWQSPRVSYRVYKRIAGGIAVA